MSKTIEEVARKYVADVYDGDTDFIDEAENVLSWMFAQPLSERLTEDEKEKARKYYQYLSECILGKTADVEYLKGKRTMLVLILGKEMFNESNQEK